MKISVRHSLLLFLLLIIGCKKKSTPPAPEPPKQVTLKSIKLNAVDFNALLYGVNLQPVIRLQFSQPLKQSTVTTAVKLYTATGVETAITTSLQNNDSVLIVQPTAALASVARYQFKLIDGLQSASGGNFIGTVDNSFITQIDSSRKFPAITDDELLTKVQQQTFKYFWDFAHATSGLARERNTSGDLVTSGGSGFGAMAIVTGINRNFITRAQGLQRMQTIVEFLKTKAQKFHGAFPHWLNGNTGNVIAFSAKDDGADLVETSLLMMGLLTARQYFNVVDAAETNLRNDITALYNAVEWSWFRKNNEQQLYWHWSPNYAWDMNLPIRGWNECLITYVLAASSATYGIPKTVYDNGWARNGAAGFVNGAQYYNITLPLGSAYGGPLFLSHYSFMGINPNGLVDAYANYETQTKNHSRINYQYCVTNPNGNYGYSDSIWGLTASDIPNGYTASSPSNDVSVIAPTAAISSMAYTPTESMKALKFFYYVMGDKLFKEYGFIDAFSLKQTWFASSFLAIDQGPIIVMIENHRSGLLWSLFTSCPEVKNGMRSLGFSAPYL
ncbi:beta-glucosidase [Lacibacter luteus]|uniref:Beta-glucosidase n=1 Tax=Lacibacter luteus TaxID=2508719 RepID=A0A4V1M814_9BACT|nr:glucoamylase family protein [Lacibacter luteus]RXK62262.1 beta-glucosidase [Lacibacter luteus]